MAKQEKTVQLQLCVSQDEYQGHKLLAFSRDEDDRYSTKLGVGKLSVALANAQHVIKFLLENGGEAGRLAVEEFQKHFQPVPKAAKKEKVK